jgi:MFS family permease
MSQYALLRLSRFLPLFVTQFLGAFNDNIFRNALVIFITFTVAEQSDINSTILVIMAGGIFFLPFFLLSATAGQLADKFEKAMMIRYIKTAEIVIMLGAAVGFLAQNVWVLLFILFLNGAQSAFFGPLKYGILPQHLTEHELTGGNGLVQMGTYVSILLGTIIGGVLVAQGQAGPLAVGAALIAVAVAGRWASNFIPYAAPPEPGLRVDPNIARQTLVIMRYALESRGVFLAVVAISWFWFTGATFLSLVPSYTRDVILGDEYVATLLLTAFSVGIGLGSLLCERFSRSRIEPGLVPIGALGIAVFAADLYFAAPAAALPGQLVTVGAFVAETANWRVLVDLSLIGFFGGLYVVPLYAMVQHRCNPAHRARIIAANNVLNSLFMVASALLVIALVSLGWTPRDVFLLMAALTLVATGAIFTAWPEFIQRGLRLLERAVGRSVPAED